MLSFAVLALLQATATATAEPTKWSGALATPPAGSSMPLLRSAGSVLDTAGATVTLILATAQPSGFGIIRSAMPTDTLWKRVRIVGEIRTTATVGTSLWLRVDNARGTAIRIDNGEPRRLSATANWIPFETVLDVPPEARSVAFGVILWGTGDTTVRRLRLIRE